MPRPAFHVGQIKKSHPKVGMAFAWHNFVQNRCSMLAYFVQTQVFCQGFFLMEVWDASYRSGQTDGPLKITPEPQRNLPRDWHTRFFESYEISLFSAGICLNGGCMATASTPGPAGTMNIDLKTPLAETRTGIPSAYHTFTHKICRSDSC
jgi:hypothetical protein